MGATERLARVLAQTTYESLPQQAIQVVREILLDGVSNMLAGSQEPLAEHLTEYVHGLGGPPQATVVGRGMKTHMVHAAFANGSFCHSMDYELQWNPPTHPTGPVLPALLALAEHRGYPGRQVALALVLGFEVHGRLRVAEVKAGAPPRGGGLHYPGFSGMLSSASACAKLMGLDEWKTRMAIGIAASRVSSITANSGTMTKSTHCGHAARMGLESALLAERGYTASEDVLEAREGYNQSFFGNKLDLDGMVDEFGNPYRILDPGLIVKKYPAQYWNHWSIDAALELRRRHHLNPQEIERVEVEVPKGNGATWRPQPKTGLDGKFSIHYTVSAALLDGKVVIDTFRDERRFAPDMEAMLKRATVVENPQGRADFEHAYARVTVWNRDGSTYTHRVDRPLGIWDNPLAWEGRLAKYHDCAQRVLARKEADALLRHIERFESLERVTPLMDLARTPTIGKST
ncbi:MAG: MmgE/PrpD family protein [Chloroflexi bacterium]|nr:MmgE/PrpD family protein [Chloroflexota bacterium]